MKLGLALLEMKKSSINPDDGRAPGLPWVGASSAAPVDKEVRGIVCASYPCVKLYAIF